MHKRARSLLAFILALVVLSAGSLWAASSLWPGLQIPLFHSEKGATPPSWADKLTAIGTVSAVSLSLGLAVMGYVKERKGRIELQRRRDLEARRSQAEGVHWWIEPCPDHPLTEELVRRLAVGPEINDMNSCWGKRLVIENRSDLPIHNLQPIMTEWAMNDGPWDFVSGIGPGVRSVRHLAGDGGCLLALFGVERPSLVFGDATGVIWRRLESGALVEEMHVMQEIEKERHEAELSVSRAVGQYELDRVAAQKHEVALKRYILPTFFEQEKHRDELQLRQADAWAFRILQESWPLRSERIASVIWWQWRSGKLSFEEAASALGYRGYGVEKVAPWRNLGTRNPEPIPMGTVDPA